MKKALPTRARSQAPFSIVFSWFPETANRQDRPVAYTKHHFSRKHTLLEVLQKGSPKPPKSAPEIHPEALQNAVWKNTKKEYAPKQVSDRKPLQKVTNMFGWNWTFGDLFATFFSLQKTPEKEAKSMTFRLHFGGPWRVPPLVLAPGLHETPLFKKPCFSCFFRANRLFSFHKT